MGKQRRIILHIDMNAFFAACEQLRDPSLKGKPIAVGSKHSRSVLSTASYEARAYGVRAAMPPYQALKLCPHLIIVEPHFDLYMEYSQKFMAIIMEKTHHLQVGSIDECYVDATEWLEHETNPLEAIRQLQDEIRQRTGLFCSIGVAPNMLLAKMASDMKKPNGLTVLRRSDCPKKMWPLPIGSLFGIGKKTAARLLEVGVTTIGDLATAEIGTPAYEVLGNGFEHFKRWANGIDDAPIKVDEDSAKSIGNSTTLGQNTTNYDEIRTVMSHLAKSVAHRAQEAKMIGITVQITLKYDDFSVNNRSKKLTDYTDQFDIIYATAMALVERHYNGVKPIRLLGVTLQNLIERSQYFHQVSLFDEPHRELPADLQKVIANINQKLGSSTVDISSLYQRKEKSHHDH